MFTGFPSTQTPAVQWWDFSKPSTGTTRIALANDCAPVQYFATGYAITTIQVTLPPNPAQGKTITIKNDKYATSVQTVQIIDNLGQVCFNLGQSGSITCCYISQNTLTGTSSSNWVIITGGSSGGPLTTYAITLGGDSNATGTNSAAIGGSSNTSSGTSSATISGSNNTASGINATILGGTSNTSSGTSSAIIGATTSTANAANSVIVGGQVGTTRSIIGNLVSSASSQPISGTIGGSQLAMLILGRQTTDATATVLASNASAAAATNQITLPDNAAYYFRGEVIAGVTGAGDTKGWYIEGVIKRGAGVATTVLVGTPSVTSLYADAGATTWTVAVTANTTLGCLTITVTGQAATTIRWVAQIRTTEMTY
jgi:hypothetical protein